MSERWILVGGRAFGRELVNWQDDAARAGIGRRITAFLDDDPSVMEGYDYGLTHLGAVETFTPQPGDRFVMGLGEPKPKKHYAELIKAKGGQFVQVIHPSAVIARTARLGEGVVVCPQVSISVDSVIGNFVAINGKTGIGHDVRIGDYSTLSGQVELTGWVEVEEGVFFGSGARVLPKIKVRAWAKVGAGAVVMRLVPAEAVVYAEPARKL